MMKVTVLGLWHLGSVISACLASQGHKVLGIDEDSEVISKLLLGKAPLYEPGTDTLRRSLSIELCEWILLMGGEINVYDPAVKKLPKDWKRTAKKCLSVSEVLEMSDVLVVATDWPEFREIKIDSIALEKKDFAVFDANCFLKEHLSEAVNHYYSVGVPVSSRGTK